MAKLSGNIEYYTFAVQGVSVPFLVRGFGGSEHLSKLYEFTLDLATEEAAVVIDDLLGKPGLITCLGEAEEPVRFIHGMVHSVSHAGQDEHYNYYKIVITPALKLLSYRRDSRIFQNMAVEDIVREVFKGAGIPSDAVSFALQGSYEAREYCVQYQETDLDFISRLMAEEGITYYFEYTENNHTLVIADNVGVYKEILAPSEVLYHIPTSLVTDEEFVNSINITHQVRSGSVSLDDYNYTKPAVDLSSNKQANVDQAMSVYYYPGDYQSKDIGKQRVDIRLEELQRDKRLINGRSDCRRLIPGFRFTLTDHAIEEFNQEYLIVGLKHSAEQPQVTRQNAQSGGGCYNNQFLCIPIDVSYRPDFDYQKTTMQGIQTAVVVGPAGEEIYTDEYGRIKVQFHWDRLGQNNEQSSCWLRVSQAWAGSGWGAMFIPRISQEVIVDFINGDPDKPIVTGSVYNASHMPPYQLPQDKTKTTIKTNSSKGGGGFNELRFEDKKGEEQVFIHAEKNQDNRTKNDSLEWVGNDRHLMIKKNQFEIVEADKHQQVKGDHNQKIDGSLSIKTASDVQMKSGGSYAHDAGGEIHLKAGSKLILEASSEISIKAGGSFIKIDSSGVTAVGSMVKLNSGGSAGSGRGASPEMPKNPLEAEAAEAGKVGEVPAPPPPMPAGPMSPAAAILSQAAKEATPFCEKCAAAAAQ